MFKARERARKFLKWLLIDLREKKLAYVGHYEIFQLIFDEFFKRIDDQQAAYHDEDFGKKEIFPWKFEFRNAQIQPAYLCPSNVLVGQTLCLNDEEQIKFEIESLEKTGPIYSKKKTQAICGEVKISYSRGFSIGYNEGNNGYSGTWNV